MPDSPLTFRFATAADVPRIVLLVESAYRGEVSQQGWTSEAHLLGGQRINAAMVEELLARSGGFVVLAERGGDLVACCELQAPGRAPKDGPSCEPEPAINPPPGEDDGRAAYFGMFAVNPTLQGDGLGKLVLAEAERIAAADWGASTMEMTVIEQRAELIAWYERRGYVRTGATKPFPYGDERFGDPKVDDLRMVVLAKGLR